MDKKTALKVLIAFACCRLGWELDCAKDCPFIWHCHDWGEDEVIEAVRILKGEVDHE